MRWKERAEFGLLRREAYHGCEVRVYADRIAIEAPDDRPLSWELLQAIKRLTVGDIEAVEYYPPEADTVNLRNTRHLWYGPAHVRNHPEFAQQHTRVSSKFPK